MPVKSAEPIPLYGLFISGLLFAVPIQAEELPSMDFLEYLGAEENEVDGELSGPVVLNLEQYLIATNPGSDEAVTSEDNIHE